MTKTKNYAKKIQKQQKDNEKGTNKFSRNITQIKKNKGFLENRLNSKVRDWNESKIAKNLLEVEKRHLNFEKDQNEIQENDLYKENNNREAENTRRQFRKELNKVLCASDIIIQVLDARDPEKCRNKALEREIIANNKKLILLINKVDLIPKEAMLIWQKKLQIEFPTLVFKCGNKQGSNLTQAKDADIGLMHSTSSVLGADSLLQLLKNYARNKAGTKKAIAVGIVGYPNVGKSSVINSLKKSFSKQAYKKFIFRRKKLEYIL